MTSSRRPARGLRLLLVAAVTLAALATPAMGVVEMAITIDDLPVHGPAPAGVTRLQIVQDMIRALQRHGVRHVWGFMNGGKVRDEGETVAILRAWTDAGFRLGNHTFSHLDLNRVTAERFLLDIENNEPLLARLDTTASPKMFRYPFLREGDTMEKRATIRRWLQAHGYQIAPVTVNFDDWAWNEPYARCRSTNREADVAWLKQTFLRAARDRLAWSDATARDIFGRPIRHVLLLHAAAFNTVALDELLTAYEAAGVRWSALADALADPAYAEDAGIAVDDYLTFLELLLRARPRLPRPSLPIPFGDLKALCP